MDAVKSFIMELSSLYEVKPEEPPISKAKLTALTREALKAIQFNKYVVQSVETFILKCKPECKMPGLYLIDSIVRQSRQQVGSDKDVFAPRFCKNIQETFVNLFKCPAEDKNKIVSVLNLWQKNQVFPPEVIHPLFDLANLNNPIYKELENNTQQQEPPANGLNSITASIIKADPNVLQLQQLQRLVTKTVGNSSRTEQPVPFDKRLLDFDYYDNEDDEHPSPRSRAGTIPPIASLSTNPKVVRELQTLQKIMANVAQLPSQEMDSDKMRKLQEMKRQEDEFDKRLAQIVPNLPFAAECDFGNTPNPETKSPVTQTIDKGHSQDDNKADVEVINLDSDDSRSQSPDNGNKKRRSRSKSKDRRGRKSGTSWSRLGSRSRNRMRSRDRSDGLKKNKEKTKEEKEKEFEIERERKKRGLPPVKKDCLSICSTTLWVGHLSKLVHPDDLSNTFGVFGDIVSIDLIPPRGCAFIVMLRRRDAATCLTKLKGHNLHGKSITLAWAPSKGVKGKDLKDYWEGDLGVSYVPYAKLDREIDIDIIEDGGMIDEETMPDWMKEKVDKMAGKKTFSETVPTFTPPSTRTTIDTYQAPPMTDDGTLQPPPYMPIIPIGVPSPNIARPLMMGNQLFGIGSPFQEHSRSNVLQLQQLQRLITKNVGNSSRAEEQVHFDDKLLDFDYDNEDDDRHSSPRSQQPTGGADSMLPVTNLLMNPEVFRQLQTLQKIMANVAQLPCQEMDKDKMRKLQEDEFDQHLAQIVPNLPSSELDFGSQPNPITGNNYFLEGKNPEFDVPVTQTIDKGHNSDNNADLKDINLGHDDFRSRSPRDKYKTRRRSRSRTRDRRGRNSRRSRSRSGSRRRNRSRSRDRKDRLKRDKQKTDVEKLSKSEKERKQRGLPPIKKDYLSICSTTLWVGHLSKLVHQDDLSNTFGEFGDIVSINLIPPRGCAYIVMLRRQDAARCLTKLKGHYLHGKLITLAWAPGKGVKVKELKDYWEGDLGVSYVPYAILKRDIDIDMIEDGGMIEEETMADWIREKVDKMREKKASLEAVPTFMPPTTLTVIDTSQPPPIPGATFLQPPPIMTLTNPFQINNRLLGMNVPSGMTTNMSGFPNVHNIPVGVPLPHMAGPLMMGNQLLSIGSPFQGPPIMMLSQMPPVDNKSLSARADANFYSLGKSLVNISKSLKNITKFFGTVPQSTAPHRDAIDTKMEDVEKSEKSLPFNGQQPDGGTVRRDREEDRRNSRDGRDRRNTNRDRFGEIIDRDREHRDRRDRDRNRRYNSRDRSGDRDRDTGRRGDRRDTTIDNRGLRDRNNCWADSDRDRCDRDGDGGYGKDREKTLNDKLIELAGMGGGFEDRGDRNRFRDRDGRFEELPPLRGRPMRGRRRSRWGADGPPMEFEIEGKGALHFEEGNNMATTEIAYDGNSTPVMDE